MSSILILITGVLGCGIIEPPDSGLSGDLASYDGTEQLVISSSPDDTSCSLYWSASGSPAALGCATCAFTFDIDFTFNDALSTQDGTCSGRAVDRSETYVLVSDDGGYQIGTWDGSSYALFASASFDPDSGGLTYSTQGDTAAYGYYTQRISGTATVQ